MLDEFGGGRRHLTSHGRGYGRRSSGNRLLLGRATGQKQAKYQPGFSHPLCFRSARPGCRWQPWLHATRPLKMCRGKPSSTLKWIEFPKPSFSSIVRAQMKSSTVMPACVSRIRGMSSHSGLSQHAEHVRLDAKKRQNPGPARRSHLQLCPKRNDRRRPRGLLRSAHPGGSAPASPGSNESSYLPQITSRRGCFSRIHACHFG